MNFRLTFDKWLHLVIGTMFFCVVLMIFNTKVAIISTCVLAIFKEINDVSGLIPFLLTNKKKRKSGFSYPDMFWTIILPLVISALISWLK